MDLVLYSPRGLVAIEVKRADRLRGGELDGLNAFIKEYPVAKCIFVYGDSERLSFDKIQVIPIVDFLKNIELFL